jgi:cellulose synthase/poly-beta-1,6-N-acetylglucosamine synthase-like glycosyltransferase
MTISIIIPAFNVEKSIGACLDALLAQTTTADCEIIVVDDGSCDTTRAVAATRDVRVIAQQNTGAAAARNTGAQTANGEIILFIDGDCIPEQNWVQAMLAPFADPEIVGACGMKQTKQRGIIPRFIQMEYDYRYERERRRRHIDFLDSGTAAYRRDVFLKNGGFDVQLSDAEDVDLSYRLSERGYCMAFAAQAIVYDPHPESLIEYLHRKFIYAYWRSQVYARFPSKLASDSRTPQTQKLQGALAAIFGSTLVAGLFWHEALWLSAACVVVFLLTTLPFVMHFFRREPLIALLAPLFIGSAAFAGGLGIILGLTRRRAK